jgi:succinate dehydrogenase/fumarate reductase flavoprotein subunit
MSEAWWAPAMRVPAGSIDGAPLYRMLFMDLARPGGLLVDRNAERFVDEAANYNDLGRAMFAFDAGNYRYPAVPSWYVFDATRRAEDIGPLAPVDPDPEWLVRADTLDELAALIELEPRRLSDSVARFNELATLGIDEDFGRGSFAWDRVSSGGGDLRALAEPPFYALAVLPGCLGTKGGPRIDDRGRVLGIDADEPIPGLYAAGNAAANPFGYGYPGPGATIGPALIFGWRAGVTAASGD